MILSSSNPECGLRVRLSVWEFSYHHLTTKRPWTSYFRTSLESDFLKSKVKFNTAQALAKIKCCFSSYQLIKRSKNNIMHQVYKRIKWDITCAGVSVLRMKRNWHIVKQPWLYISAQCNAFQIKLKWNFLNEISNIIKTILNSLPSCASPTRAHPPPGHTVSVHWSWDSFPPIYFMGRFGEMKKKFKSCYF